MLAQLVLSVVVVIIVGPVNLSLKFGQTWVCNRDKVIVVCVVDVFVVSGELLRKKTRTNVHKLNILTKKFCGLKP